MNLPQPIPSAGLEAYVSERKARFLLSPKCAENYDRYLAGRFKAKVDYLPIKLDIENASRCNFRCEMCAVSTWPKGKRTFDMRLLEFENLIDEQYGLVEIKLNGLGEALMQGEDYFKMIEYARDRRIWVRMTTNGSLLHLKHKYRRLVNTGVNEIDISVDGPTKEIYESIRIGGNFERTAANCKLINGYCEDLGITRTKMWVLVQKRNRHSLHECVDLAASLGFRHLVFSTGLHGWADPTLEARNAKEQESIPEFELMMLVSRGQKLGVRVSFWDVNAKFDAHNLCPWPFSRAVVTSDLRTVPCCMIANPDQYEIGKGKSFMENWTGTEYQEFRKRHLNGQLPSVCKGCYR